MELLDKLRHRVEEIDRQMTTLSMEKAHLNLAIAVGEQYADYEPNVLQEVRSPIGVTSLTEEDQPEAPAEEDSGVNQDTLTTGSDAQPGNESASTDPEDDACPHDPDGQHFVGCGCDYQSPDDLEPTETAAPSVRVRSRRRKAPRTHGGKKKSELIIEVVREHPDWTTKQIAASVGVGENAVSAHLSHVGTSLTALREQIRKEQASSEPEPEAEPDQPEPQPVEPEPTRPEPPKAQPEKQTPPKPKTGQKFHLRQHKDSGKYLHESGQGLVEGKTYAWKGTQEQLLAARQKFGSAADLVEVPIIE